MASDKQRAKEIDELLSTIEPKFRRAFEVGLTSMSENISISGIEDAIARGDFNTAINLINETIVATAFIEFQREIQNAVQAGGDIASRWAKADKIVFSLNVTESNTARFINSYQADKIREITEDFQNVLGETIRNGINEGLGPREIARQFRSSIGLTVRQEQAIRNYEKLLREGDSGALDRALRDRRFDRSVAESIAGRRPLTEDQIERMIQRYRDKYIKYRAETIARTEAVRLVSVGQTRFWESLVEEGKVEKEAVYKKWIVTQDGRLRESHASIPRLNPGGVPMNAAFMSTLGPIRFPGDPAAPIANVANCRCALFYKVRV